MKVFIVFLCVLILSVGFFVYESDLSNYLRLESYLKALSEEAAVAAAMYYDEQRFGQGFYILSETEGLKAVGYLVTEANRALSEVREGILTYRLELFDAEKGFDGTDAHPSAKVTVTYTSSDLFRLPFLRVTSVTRQGKYAVK
jgi:hypothetical protein